MVLREGCSTEDQNRLQKIAKSTKARPLLPAGPTGLQSLKAYVGPR
ncbi:MAG: hypothetical protein ACI9OU_002162 [Candidatus Promineifilaceae bacterium]|jgi:hypothetical protein